MIGATALIRRSRRTALAVAMTMALVAVLVVQQPAAADDAKFYLICPTTEVREGDSFDVTLVRVTNHQHNAPFGATWYTDPGSAGTGDYTVRSGDFAWGTAEDSRDNKITETFHTTSDTAVEGNETFTVRFGPVSNVVFADDPAGVFDNTCEITIIDDDPRITSFDVWSRPAIGDTYGVGEVITIAATFTPSLGGVGLGCGATLFSGGTSGLVLLVGDNFRVANYAYASGWGTMAFQYRVEADDLEARGISMDPSFRTRDGSWSGFICPQFFRGQWTPPRGYVGPPVYGGHDGMNTQFGHKVNGDLQPRGTRTAITSSPRNGDTYRVGETIEFTVDFSVPVDVPADRYLSFRLGQDPASPTASPKDSSRRRQAAYQSGSGTRTVTFAYTVGAADLDADGVDMLGATTASGDRVQGPGGASSITLAGSSTVVYPTYTALDVQAGHKVDGRPLVQSIALTSAPTARSDTYGVGEVIRTQIDFDQNVTAGSDAKVFVVMDAAGTPVFKEAALVSGSGTPTLEFEYVVQASDRDADGVYAYLPYSQDITATGTDAAYQRSPADALYWATDELSGHKVDGSLAQPDLTAPTVSSVGLADVGASQTFSIGDTITATVVFSENVTVSGTPQLEFDIGGVARAADYANASGHTAAFGYTVQAGDTDTDGVSIGADKITLNGGTIRDSAGNDAVLTHAAVPAVASHLVDGVRPTVARLQLLSNPPRGRSTWLRNDLMVLAVGFSEDVVVTGAPQLEIDIGGQARAATYSRSDGTGVYFWYVVATGDVDADGISIGADKLSLNGGTIRDSAGNDAVLTHAANSALGTHPVDAPGGV